MSPVRVISQQPPGGRCVLYARYADAVADAVGWPHRVVHSECRDAHGDGFPSLWIRGAALQPDDGVILSPDDICRRLSELGIAPEHVDTLRSRLTEVLDDFLATWAP
jgi:cystathionine gamma-synthase